MGKWTKVVEAKRSVSYDNLSNDMMNKVVRCIENQVRNQSLKDPLVLHFAKSEWTKTNILLGATIFQSTHQDLLLEYSEGLDHLIKVTKPDTRVHKKEELRTSTELIMSLAEKSGITENTIYKECSAIIDQLAKKLKINEGVTISYSKNESTELLAELVKRKLRSLNYMASCENGSNPIVLKVFM